MTTINVLLVEDDPAFCEILSLYISTQNELTLIGTASNGQEAVHLADTLAPDVILMDLHMPVMDGIDATRAILTTHPHIKIIAITTFDNYNYVSKALAAGVHGYLLKNSRANEIKAAIIAAQEGRAMIDQRALASLTVSMNHIQPPTRDTWQDLTDLEQAITRLVCLGYTNTEIAQELHYSVSTVRNTLTSIYKKLEITTRTQLLVHAGQQNYPVLD